MKRGCWPVALAMGLVCHVMAQNGPQHHWTIEETRGWNSAAGGPGPLAGAWGLAVDTQQVFVGDSGNARIQVFSRTGGFIRSWGSSGTGNGQFDTVRGLALDDAHLYVVDCGSVNRRVQVFTKDGLYVRQWGSGGSGDGQFNGAEGIALDTQHVYVADAGNHRIQVFTREGAWVRKWGRSGTVAGDFNAPGAVAVDRRYVYVADRLNLRIQVFSPEGRFIRSWSTFTNGGSDDQPLGLAVDEDSVYVTFGYQPNQYVGWTSSIRIYDKEGNARWSRQIAFSHEGPYSGAFITPRAVAPDNPLVFVADASRGVTVLRRIFRTLGPLAPDSIPVGEVLACRQREGTAVLDVDYAVDDSDDATVTVYAGGFTVRSNAFLSLADFTPMRTFVDGTDTRIGTGIVTRQVHRLSWDMEADGLSAGIPQYGNVKVSIMARDDRGLLDFHFLHIPAIGTNAAFRIDRMPLQQADLLPLWFWLLAAGDTNLTLSSGLVTGRNGVYAGQALAQGTNTTELGRAFLFERLAVREASPQEMKLAREATTPGTVTEWAPLREPPPEGSKVNAFNFVTHPTNGWWVVPLTP